MKKEDLTCILTEEIDEEILSKMPEWFRILREEYKKKNLEKHLFL